jgi:hypothetical protein
MWQERSPDFEARPGKRAVELGHGIGHGAEPGAVEMRERERKVAFS